jgi:hypothetical protein
VRGTEQEHDFEIVKFNLQNLTNNLWMFFFSFFYGEFHISTMVIRLLIALTKNRPPGQDIRHGSEARALMLEGGILRG